MDIEEKKKLAKLFIDKNMLLNSEELSCLNKHSYDTVERQINILKSFNKNDIFRLFGTVSEQTQTSQISDSVLVDQIPPLHTPPSASYSHTLKNTILDSETINTSSQLIQQDYKNLNAPRARVDVKFTYLDKAKKKEPSDFVQMFKNRYNTIEKILRNRRELQGVISISRILAKKQKEEVVMIGLVLDIQKTRNGNLVVSLEDPTAQIKTIISKNKPELFTKSKELVHDEVVGVKGVFREGVVFVSEVFWPDVPVIHELKKSPDECYAAFISDLHVGSNYFLHDEFNKFITWLQGDYGSENHKEIAAKVNYLVIVGDLIDGVGIYPGQEEELEIKDVVEQYKKCAELLAKIPKRIQIIICAGNHDAVRLAEPQPVLYSDFAEPLYNLSNITIVSNPSLVNIHKSESFSGFDILLYHGYSFDYYANNVDVVRQRGGYKKGEEIIKFLLKKRHLAPVHSSTLYIPDVEFDPLVINTVPDFFATGHTHYTVASNYRNITLLSCSCWQSKTDFQEKMGHDPQPARVPLVNLQTRAVKILKFGKD